LIIAMACLLLAGCATAPEPEPSAPTASPPAPSEGISRADAIEAAREAASQMVAEEWQIGAVTAGRLGQVVPEFENYEWARDLPTDLRVWRVGLVSGELSALVVTDFVDGSVYGVVVGIAN
jgi:hypothetical protein